MYLSVRQNRNRVGLYLLYVAALVPMFNAVRIYMSTNQVYKTQPLLYFSQIGPFNLFLAGLFSLINIIFFMTKKNHLSWYIHLIGVIWVGGSDSIGALLFYVGAEQRIFPTLLPVFVTIYNLIGLGLLKDYVFGE